MTAAFEKSEYRDRVRRVTEAMQSRGVDTLAVFAEANIVYLTGYEGFSDYVPQCAVLRAGDQDVTLILREMDLHCAYPTVYLDESKVESYPENCIGTSARSPWDVIGKRIKSIAAGGTIGLEYKANVYAHNDHLKLMTMLDGETLVDGSNLVETAKALKSPAELAYMSHAGAIVDNALQAGIAQIAEGVRECEVAATITHNLIVGVNGVGGGPSKPVTMGVGSRAAAPHLKWTNAPYRMNTQTDFEVGGFMHRYVCPLSRSVYLGDPPQRLRDLHSAVLDSFEAGFAAVKPGAECGDIYRAFAGKFFSRGFRKESRIGYSIGIDWADGCFSIQDDDRKVLEENNTFHLIIGIWEKEDAYVFSEALRVGPEGAVSFSNTPRILFER